jgi:hypothetical protein
MSMKGESDQMSVSDAVEMIHAMPVIDRSPFCEGDLAVEPRARRG